MVSSVLPTQHEQKSVDWNHREDPFHEGLAKKEEARAFPLICPPLRCREQDAGGFAAAGSSEKRSSGETSTSTEGPFVARPLPPPPTPLHLASL